MTAPVTQKDIARRLGVSQALVSRVLTGTSDRIGVAAATAEKIRQAASACHYRPSAAALTLKGGPTRTLGVVVRNFDDPFLGHMIGSLQRLAAGDGYTLLLSGWSPDHGEAEGGGPLRAYRPDGLILCGSDFQPRLADLFLAEGRPVAQICTGRVAAGVQQVAFDQRAGLDALAGAVAGMGHRRFGFVGDDSASHRRRARLLRELLRGRGLSIEFLEVPQGAEGPDLEPLRARCRRPGRRPTALIAADDAMAQAALRALHECGIRVPRDMSLAGMDDIPAARTMIPALTTIRQPVEAMVQSAFRAVTARQGKPEKGAAIVLAPELVLRESCAEPAEEAA